MISHSTNLLGKGYKKFGKDNGLKEKTNYRYLQSEKEADYIPNLKILER